MPEYTNPSERKEQRNEVQKLLALLAKRKISQEKATSQKEKVPPDSSSSSGQQSSSNSSSDESGEILQSDLKQNVANESGQTVKAQNGGAAGNGEPATSLTSNKGSLLRKCFGTDVVP